MPLIQISVNQNRIEINSEQLEKAAGRILDALGFTESELSVVIVDDEEMADLNSEYREVDSPTDVLSFPMQEGDFGDVCPEMLGDVVISAETAELMSRQCGCPLPEVLDLLLSHGILHLAGYDHERSEEEAHAMKEKTLELLTMLGRSEKIVSWYLGGDRE